MICKQCRYDNSSEARFCVKCGERLVLASPTDLGSFGPYLLRGKLGRGAMATVWRAYDPNLDREVAIKEPIFDMRLSDAAREEMTRRFIREARAAAKLQHPNIVTIYAADEYDGKPAIVMELVDGATLANMLETGPISPIRTLSVLDQLLDAVQYAHDHGVIHRDIKPDNIFVDSRGCVKLADFGIARIEDAVATHATVVGAVLGTPGYMSPEQATGSSVDFRSDLFSIGVVAYEMLSGRNPFGAGEGIDATTLLYRIVHEPAPELPPISDSRLPADLRPAIMAALAKEPNDRPQSAAEFKAMLHGSIPASTNAFATASIASARSPAAGAGLRRWLPYIAVAAACLVILAVFVNTTSGGGGGGRAAAIQTGAGVSTTKTMTETAGRYYLSTTSDGLVALYQGQPGDGSSPVKTSAVSAEDLNPDTEAELSQGVLFTSKDDAEEQLREFSVQAEEAKAEREAHEAAASTVTITVKGVDGTKRTEKIRRQGTTERVIPESNSRKLTASDIAGLTDAEKCIAWNEIIAASNGYAFKNGGLASYFGNCSWYHRDKSADASGNLSPKISANVELLKSSTDSWWRNLATS